ncbi:MAG: DinB family protein [Gemmatimonadetes bacterium]|nr:DinB family protein [Gemmatimonadota bacterium]
MISGRPQAGEYADEIQDDMGRVPGNDAVGALAEQAGSTLALLSGLSDERVASLRYAPGKWTVKEVLGHLVDDERIYAYRALCIARGDQRPLPGFDEKQYVAGARFEQRPLAELLDQYRAGRAASIALFRPLVEEEWMRRGTANGFSVTVRGLAFHMVAHEMRHYMALKEKYLRV